MRALAGYVMKGPIPAILIVTAFALISLFPVLGMLSIFSGAAVALVTLRQGAKQGLLIIAGAAVLTGLFLQLTVGAMVLGGVFALVVWLPLWALALVLRRTISWSITLDTAVAISAVAVLLVYLVAGDPVQMWQQLLTSVFDKLSAQQGGPDFGEFREQLPAIAKWMTGMLAGAMALSLLAGMMVARWWQSLLYNPGGFREEFYSLRMSRIAANIVLIVIVLSVLGLGSVSALASDLVIIAVVVYSMVGLALVHASVASTDKHVGWLVALYVLMFLMPPHVMLILAGVALADSRLDFRARLAKKSSADSNNQNNDE
ncbi:DUF2232 domain-containing protein [Pseudomonadota bacterium]